MLSEKNLVALDNSFSVQSSMVFLMAIILLRYASPLIGLDLGGFTFGLA
jgi:hypothetical protein